MLKSENVVGENNYLVVTPFVMANQKLTSSKLVRIHNVEKLKEMNLLSAKLF